MHMTDRGLLALVRHEGLVPGPYLDVKNVWTFGIGHTAAAGPPDPARMPRGMPADLDAGIREAFRLFRADIVAYEAEVLRAVKAPLEPHEFDALVCFHYNTGGIARASLTRHLNAGNRAAAAQGFMGWLRPAAIRSRREAERDLFRDGRYPTGTIPVWAVDRNGRVGFLAASPAADRDRGAGIAAPGEPPVPAVAGPTRRGRPAEWLARRVLRLLSATSPGADPCGNFHRARSPGGRVLLPPDRPGRACSARAWPARRPARLVASSPAPGCRAGDADHARRLADRSARPVERGSRRGGVE